MVYKNAENLNVHCFHRDFSFFTFSSNQTVDIELLYSVPLDKWRLYQLTNVRNNCSAIVMSTLRDVQLRNSKHKIIRYYYRNFSSLCNLLHSPVTSSLLGPNILLNTIFSNNLSFLSSLNVSDQVSQCITCKVQKL